MNVQQKIQDHHFLLSGVSMGVAPWKIGTRLAAGLGLTVVFMVAISAVDLALKVAAGDLTSAQAHGGTSDDGDGWEQF